MNSNQSPYPRKTPAICRLLQIPAERPIRIAFGGGPPIKAFLEPRSKSVASQLAGNAPPPPANGGRGFMGAGRIAGMILTPGFMTAMDADKDASITRQEFDATTAKWFETWGGSQGGGLTEEQIRTGLSRDFPLPQGMPGFGRRHHLKNNL